MKFSTKILIGLGAMSASFAALTAFIYFLLKPVSQGLTALERQLSADGAALEGAAQVLNGLATAGETAGLMAALGLAFILAAGALAAGGLIRALGRRLGPVASAIDTDALAVEETTGHLAAVARQMADGALKSAARLEESAAALSQSAAALGRQTEAALEGRAALDRAITRMRRVQEAIGELDRALIAQGKAEGEGHGGEADIMAIRSLVYRANEDFRAALDCQGRLMNIFDRLDGDFRQQAAGLEVINVAIAAVDTHIAADAAAADEITGAAIHLSGRADALSDSAGDLYKLLYGQDTEGRQPFIKTSLAREMEVKSLPAT